MNRIQPEGPCIFFGGPSLYKLLVKFHRDLPHTTDGPPNWWFSEGNPLISEKSRFVKDGNQMESLQQNRVFEQLIGLILKNGGVGTRGSFHHAF